VVGGLIQYDARPGEPLGDFAGHDGFSSTSRLGQTCDGSRRDELDGGARRQPETLRVTGHPVDLL
jgi:hypothetical protein